MISLKQLVGKIVTIVTDENYEVVGKLVSFQPCRRKDHIPSILVLLRNGEEYIIIRNWKLVKMNPIISYVTKVTTSVENPNLLSH
ncbi:hypothetical protein J7K27_05685 [Candidatus Bathyarchaeota archaeon]|nr:hypothetical protein [Candidatus Bathyarchaeota archaeon]